VIDWAWLFKIMPVVVRVFSRLLASVLRPVPALNLVI
jgi:hypothetical protein